MLRSFLETDGVQMCHSLKASAALIVTLAMAPFGASAQATCPSAEMLDGSGILFAQDNGDHEVHQRAANGSISQKMTYGEYVSLNYVVHGVHVTQLSDEENGRIVPDSIWLFDFGMPLEELPVPVEGGTWSVEVTATNQGTSEPEKVRHRWGRLTSYTIGACTLNAIPVTIKYSSSDYNHTEEVMYFPDLGTGLFVAYRDSDGAEEFNFVDVRGN